MKRAIARVIAVGFAMTTLAVAAQGPAPIATQGKASVTLEDVDARAARIPPDKRGQVFDSPQRIQSIVSALLLNRQLAAEAVEAGLDKDPLVQRQLQLAREEVLARVRLEKFREGVKFDADAIARETYQVDPTRFAQGEQRVVRHILISSEQTGAITAQQRMGEVQAALARGDKFEDVAKKYSDDKKSAVNGGLVPAFSRGRMVKTFEDAAYALAKPGDRSGVIQSAYGLHLIELVEIQPARQLTFEEAKPALLEQIQRERVDAAAKEHVDRLRNNEIDADPDAILSLRTRYADAKQGTDAAKLLEPDAAASTETDAN